MGRYSDLSSFIDLPRANDVPSFHYPIKDPQWSRFEWMVDEITEYVEKERRINELRKINVDDGFLEENNPKKSMEIIDFDDGSIPKESTSKKIRFLNSSFVGSSSSSKKQTQEQWIMIQYDEECNTKYLDDGDLTYVVDQEWVPNELSKKKRKKSKCSVYQDNEEMAIVLDQEWVPNKPSKKKQKKSQCSVYEDDEEMANILDQHWVPNEPSKKKKKKSQGSIYEDDGEMANVLDQEWVPNEPSKNKQKKSKCCDSGSSRGHPHNPTLPILSLSTVNIATNTTSTHDLPQEFKNMISEMGGNDITLVIQKSLFPSDLRPHQNRLSMPLHKINNPGFLHESELEILERKEAIQVPIIQPSLDLKTIALGKWNMRSTSNYILRSTWTKIAQANQLKPHDEVQVWSFRVQDKLHLALVKL